MKSSSSSLLPVLSNENIHQRDKNIQFFEKRHKYVILTDRDSKYTSVTTWIHSHFPKFDSDVIIDSMMKGKIGKRDINTGEKQKRRSNKCGIKIVLPLVKQEQICIMKLNVL